MRRGWCWIASVVAVAACTSSGTKNANPVVASIPAVGTRDFDVLLVIDDSPRMGAKQQSLAENLPNLINVLNAPAAGLPNLHIGVVSTDLGVLTRAGTGNALGTPGQPGACSGTGKGGKLQKGMATALTQSFLSDIAQSGGSRQTNYTGSLATVLGDMVKLGDFGCGFPQPLEAAKLALTPSTGNTGFRRPNAALVLVFFTDSDDCSLATADAITDLPISTFSCFSQGIQCAQDATTPGTKTACAPRTDGTLVQTDTYRDFFSALVTSPDLLLVTTLAGPETPVKVEAGVSGPELAASCTVAGADDASQFATPPLRLAAVRDDVLVRASTSICSADLSGSLDEIAAAMNEYAGVSCIPDTTPLADVHNPDRGYDCTAVDVLADGTTSPLVQCNATTLSECFSIGVDPDACAGALRVSITRGEPAPDGTVTQISCRPPSTGSGD